MQGRIFDCDTGTLFVPGCGCDAYPLCCKYELRLGRIDGMAGQLLVLNANALTLSEFGVKPTQEKTGYVCVPPAQVPTGTGDQCLHANHCQ